jgi:hypothetical protein
MPRRRRWGRCHAGWELRGVWRGVGREAWGRAQKIVRRAATNRNSPVAVARGAGRKPSKSEFKLRAEAIGVQASACTSGDALAPGG